MMISKLTDLFERAKQVIQDDGWFAFVRNGFAFVVGNVFRYENYYLNERSTASVAGLNEADFTPKISDFALKIISSNREVDRLSAEGFDFRPWYRIYRRRLDAGAIAFCTFVGRELASIVWVATTQQAMGSLGEPPYEVDFEAAESASGGAWTNPKYRRLGFYAYARLKRLQFLTENGITIDRAANSKQNTALNLSVAKFAIRPKIREGCYLKILWWKSWKEKPLPQSGNQSLPG